MQQPGDVVVGGDEQGCRVGEGVVVEPATVASTWPCGEMSGRSRTASYSRRAIARTGVGGQQPVGVQEGQRPGSRGGSPSSVPSTPEDIVSPGTGRVQLTSTRPAAARAAGGAPRWREGMVTTAGRAFVREQLAAVDLDGRSVCVLVPDATRGCPLPLLLAAVHGALHGRVERLTVLVALGTHAADDRGSAGATSATRRALAETYPGMTVVNHEWWDPETFATSGRSPPSASPSCPAGCCARTSGPGEPRGRRARRDADRRAGLPARGGRLLRRQQVLVPRGVRPRDDRPVALARRADHQRRDHRHARHHPGAGADRRGRRAGPGRAARPVRGRPRPAPPPARHLRSATPEAAWAAAAEVSAETHVRYLDAPVRRVLSLIPREYEDMWTGAKGFYKVEPIVADGGQVMLYAPHITEISAIHPVISRSAITAGTTSSDSGIASRISTGATSRTRPTCAGPARTTRPGRHRRVTVTLATGIPEDRPAG